jgi:hypothetical protein
MPRRPPRRSRVRAARAQFALLAHSHALPHVQRRDTAAGRALFALYGGHAAAARAGVTFSSRNRRRFARAPQRPPPAAPLPPPAPPGPRKAAVSVPRVGLGRCAADGAPAPPSPPRRRPAAAILADLRAAEAEAAAACAGAAPRGPAMGEAEKERLAQLMEYRGRPPKPPPRCGGGGGGGDGDGGGGDDGGGDDGGGDCRSGRGDGGGGAGGEARRLQARFERLELEVAEREAWLAQMRRDGLARPEHAGAMRLEIAERAAEMARLDARLRRLEGRAEGPGA